MYKGGFPQGEIFRKSNPHILIGCKKIALFSQEMISTISPKKYNQLEQSNVLNY